jgi:hypothetical protein
MSLDRSSHSGSAAPHPVCDSEPSAADGWRSIAEDPAPRGVPVWLSDGNEVAVCEWHRRSECWRERTTRGDAIEHMGDFGIDYLEFHGATHWQPIPAPPKDGQ